MDGSNANVEIKRKEKRNKSKESDSRLKREGLKEEKGPGKEGELKGGGMD